MSSDSSEAKQPTPQEPTPGEAAPKEPTPPESGAKSGSKNARFKVGDKVRVKAGVKDPDNPDIPLGRWCGTVEEVEVGEGDEPPGYLIRWGPRTLKDMPGIFIKRCRRDGMEFEEIWLEEPDLEEDDGVEMLMEKPTNIITRPLDESIQDDRLRAIFGLTTDDPLPEVDTLSLRRYLAHLEKNLTFPLDVTFLEDGRPVDEKGIITKLLPEEDFDRERGIMCRARVKGGEGKMPLDQFAADEATPAGKLLADYRYWMENWERVPDVLAFPKAPHYPSYEPEYPASYTQEPPQPFGGELPQMPGHIELRLTLILAWAALIGAIYGMTLSVLAFVEQAPTGMAIGGVMMAVMGGVVGRRYGLLLVAMGQSPRAPTVGTTLGVLAGGLIGALFGALLIGAIGSVPGSIVGILVAEFAPRRRKILWKIAGFTLGACIGGIIFAFVREYMQDGETTKSTVGLLVGLTVGVIGAMFIALLGLLIVLSLLGRRE